MAVLAASERRQYVDYRAGCETDVIGSGDAIDEQ
jgi:hypothetical protein